MLGPAGLSSDSGLGGSTDGSTDILAFGSVVDSVTEEGKCAGGLAPEYHQVCHQYQQLEFKFYPVTCIYWPSIVC